MKIFRNIITELKQTNWPTWSQLLSLTGYTIVICGVVALIILGLDLLFFEVRDIILNI
jgi:preprotein translocase SecE subunit